MRVSASAACGALAGVNLLLGLAVMTVVAANGANNPGFGRAVPSAAAGSTAASPAPLPDGSFQGLDLNGDGRISLAEATGHPEIMARFDRADRDRDGHLSKYEFARLAKLPPPKPAAKGRSLREQMRRDATTAAAGA